MTKSVVAVLFGGRSVEHEVSVITGHQVMDALETAVYRVLPVYIAKDGRWYAGEPLRNLPLYQEQTFHASALRGVERVYLSLDRSTGRLMVEPRQRFWFSQRRSLWADVFFPT